MVNGDGTSDPGGDAAVYQVDFDLLGLNAPSHRPLGPVGLEAVGSDPSMSSDNQSVISVIVVPIRKFTAEAHLVITNLSDGSSEVVENEGGVGSLPYWADIR